MSQKSVSIWKRNKKRQNTKAKIQNMNEKSLTGDGNQNCKNKQ